MPRVIVGVSGGKCSSWCAKWALDNFPKEDVILYHNDIKWEHPDTYRVLDQLSKYLNHPITDDSDGRNPEQVFYDKRYLANDRAPICSKVLKGFRLQDYFEDGDIIIFGINADEYKRVERIRKLYEEIGRKKKKKCTVMFPAYETQTSAEEVDEWYKSTGIEEHQMYKDGFLHSNCYGGCVRQGKKQWKQLYDTYPEVYLDRERVERDIRKFLAKDVHYLKDETLESLRIRYEQEKVVDALKDRVEWWQSSLAYEGGSDEHRQELKKLEESLKVEKEKLKALRPPAPKKKKVVDE